MTIRDFINQLAYATSLANNKSIHQDKNSLHAIDELNTDTEVELLRTAANYPTDVLMKWPDLIASHCTRQLQPALINSYGHAIPTKIALLIQEIRSNLANRVQAFLASHMGQWQEESFLSNFHKLLTGEYQNACHKLKVNSPAHNEITMIVLAFTRVFQDNNWQQPVGMLMKKTTAANRVNLKIAIHNH
jgi:hypothetical protein